MLSNLRIKRIGMALMLLLMAALACTPELPEGADQVATGVILALTDIAGSLTPDLGSPAETPTASPTPPPGGVSLNCDGTYQKLTIVDGGPVGKTATLSTWDGSSWIDVWSFSGGDPMMQQIEAEAGLYPFGACRQLIIIPLRYSGSGVLLDLTIYEWTGAAVSQVYFHQGVHGDWSKDGDTIEFVESVYLYGEANCCPCNRQTTHHTWDGSAFVQVDQVITPTYTGTPPEWCTP
jgi:hypothetical protein